MSNIQRELATISKELEELGRLSELELNLLAGNYRRKLEMIEIVLTRLHTLQKPAVETRAIQGATR